MNLHLLGTWSREVGMGVWQMYWSYRQTYVISMQLAIRLHREPFPHPLGPPVLLTPTPVMTYVAFPQWLQAMPGVSWEPMWRRPGRPDPDDSEDTQDGRLLAAQQPTLGQPHFAKYYKSYAPAISVLDCGDVLEGYTHTAGSGFEVCSTHRSVRGRVW